MKKFFLIGLVVCSPFYNVFAFEGIQYQCDGAKLNQLTPATWVFEIDNSDAGNYAKDFILRSANNKAYQAGKEKNSRHRDYPWITKDGQYRFYSTTEYGYDIIGNTDFEQGREMITVYSNHLFGANFKVISNENSVIFNLTNNMDYYKSDTGNGYRACADVRGLRAQCVVQEFIFRNCRR
ncbi:MAG: hypothetical protein JNM39_05085 [Bdellovibrionaceae bacterium]|nr:hypothetical protein [Pseudobdellovibrionaceae bacterium]